MGVHPSVLNPIKSSGTGRIGFISRNQALKASKVPTAESILDQAFSDSVAVIDDADVDTRRLDHSFRLTGDIEASELPGDSLSMIERDLDSHVCAKEVHLPFAELRTREEPGLVSPCRFWKQILKQGVQGGLASPRCPSP